MRWGQVATTGEALLDRRRLPIPFGTRGVGLARDAYDRSCPLGYAVGETPTVAWKSLTRWAWSA